MPDSNEKGRRKRQGRRRRPFRRMRQILGFVGVPACLIGGALAGTALVLRSTPLLWIGGGYLAFGLVALAVRGILQLVGLAQRRGRGGVKPLPVVTARSDQGMALPAVLLLVSALSVVAWHALAAVHVSGRRAAQRDLQTRARLVAEQSAWRVLDTLAYADSTATDTLRFESPDGMEVTVSVREAEAPAGAAPAARGDAFLAIQTSVRTNAVLEEVYCVVRRSAAGPARVERWVTR